MLKRITIVGKIAKLLATCDSTAKRYADFDFIDVKNPYSEREVIEQMMDRQLDMRKPGFITKFYDAENGFELLYQSITYNSESGELIHQVNYNHVRTDTFLRFEAEQQTSEERYEETVDRLQDAEPLEHSNLTGFYGFTEEDGEIHYEFAAKGDDTIYFYENSCPASEGYDYALTKSIGQSLKTEADGAHSHFYDRFEFDLDQLNFPLFHQDHVSSVEVGVYDLGYWAFSNPNSVQVMYDLNEYDTKLRYSIDGMDHYSNNVGYTLVEEGETAGDIHVTAYETSTTLRSVYVWERNDHFYTIHLDSDNDLLTTENIYAIIDSTYDDNRQFENKDLFNPTNEEPDLTEIDKGVYDRLRALEE